MQREPSPCPETCQCKTTNPTVEGPQENMKWPSVEDFKEANELLTSHVRQLRLRNRWMLDEINQSDLVASLLETYLRQLDRGDLVARAKAVANRSEP